MVQDSFTEGKALTLFEDRTEGSEVTRSLLIRNLNRNLRPEIIFDEFGRFGQIRNVVFSHLHDEGFIVIDYHDLRDCARAFRGTTNVLSLFSPILCQPGTRLDVHYFMTKSEAAGTPFENEGKLLIFGLPQDFQPLIIQGNLQRFGDLRKLQVTTKAFGVATWVAEYFDLRSASTACSALNGTYFEGHHLQVAFLNGYSSWASAGFSVGGTTISPSHSSMTLNSRSRSPSPSRSTSPLSVSSLSSATWSNNSLYQDLEFGGTFPSPPSSPPFQARSPPRQQVVPTPYMGNHYQQSHQQFYPPVPNVPAHHHQHHPQMGSHIPPHHFHSGAGHHATDPKHHPGKIPQNFQIELDAIRFGFDKRTTLMVRNIPNKYTQDMFLDFINETHKGQYDFIYLPIDFKNKCNVGYAFLNLIDPVSIMGLFNRIQGKKWAKFNSEKICAVSYARIQGKDNLIRHFKNSTIMAECADYRPKIFHSSGPLKGLEEEFPESDVPEQEVPYYTPPGVQAGVF